MAWSGTAIIGAMPSDDATPGPHSRPGVDLLATLGPFFQVDSVVEGEDWRPLQDLISGPALGERVAHVTAVLGRLAGAEVEPRVAASTLSLGLFARVLSPVLGAAALGILLPRPTLDDTFWKPVAAGPWALALTGAVTTSDLTPVIAEVVEPLVETVADQYALSRQVLWGNAASALFGGARMLGVARPELAARAEAEAAVLLAGPLAGTGGLDDGFVRSSCCLYYRIPGGGYCGDCVLAHPPAVSAPR